MWSIGRNNLKPLCAVLVLGALLGLIVGYVLWGSRSDTDRMMQDRFSGHGVEDSAVGKDGREPAGNEKLTAITARASGEMAEFRDVLTGGRASISSKARYYELLMNLTPETAPELQKFFSELKGTTDRNIYGDHREFWRRWAEIDPERACAAAFETNRSLGKSELKRHSNSSSLARATILTWAGKEPAAARDWLLAQQDVPFLDVLIEGFLDGTGRSHPEEAQRFLEEEEMSDELKRHGYLRIAWGLFDQGVDEVDQWFRSIDEDHPMKESIGRTTAGLIIDGDIGEALGWADRLENPELMDYARRQLVEDRPEDLLKFIGKTEDLSAVSDASGLVSKATHKWLSNYNGDRVGIWLEQQEDNPNYDLLATPFVRDLVSRSPTTAVKWVETIRDPELRSTLQADLEKSLDR